MVELTTQLLILASILWLPLCRIYKFGLNTLPSKTIVNPYTCGLSMPFDFEISVKEFMSSQKNFNTLIEEIFLKIDDLARNMDRISLDVDSLKLRSIPPKHDI